MQGYVNHTMAQGARDYVKLWEKKTRFMFPWHRESLFMGSLFFVGKLLLRGINCSTTFIGGLFSLGGLDMVEVICFLAFIGGLFFVGDLFLRGIKCSTTFMGSLFSLGGLFLREVSYTGRITFSLRSLT